MTTPTQETPSEGEEYVIYRLRDGRANYVRRRKWDRWSEGTKRHVGAELVAEGLTEQQAYNYCRLTKEN